MLCLALELEVSAVLVLGEQVCIRRCSPKHSAALSGGERQRLRGQTVVPWVTRMLTPKLCGRLSCRIHAPLERWLVLPLGRVGLA